jgi:hypothetical protein
VLHKVHKPKHKALVVMRTAVAIWSRLLPQFGFAFSHRLTESEVRDAYFLGQDSERATPFRSQYGQALPVPNTGPHVAQMELRTPYAQVVAISRQHSTGTARNRRRKTTRRAATRYWFVPR